LKLQLSEADILFIFVYKCVWKSSSVLLVGDLFLLWRESACLALSSVSASGGAGAQATQCYCFRQLVMTRPKFSAALNIATGPRSRLSLT